MPLTLRTTVTGLPTTNGFQLLDLYGRGNFSTTSTSPITDGLIVYLDAENIKSNIGGTTWYDLSGAGNHATLLNGATFTTSGSMKLMQTDGVDDYANITLDLRTSNHTIIGASRYVGTGNKRRTFSSVTNNWLMGHYSGYTENHFAEGWITPGSGANGPQDNNWRIYTAWRNHASDLSTFYSNNTVVSGNSTAASQGPQNIGLGGPSFGEYSSAYFSFLLVYNRVLDSKEILYTYNLFKSRFGLS